MSDVFYLSNDVAHFGPAPREPHAVGDERVAHTAGLFCGGRAMTDTQDVCPIALL